MKTSKKGYKHNSPDVNKPYNIINGGNITMKGVKFKVSGTDDEGEEFVVSDPASIREFLENADANVGKQIEGEIANIAKIGVNKQVKMQCENCETVFEKDIGFDPVNFSTAS